MSNNASTKRSRRWRNLNRDKYNTYMKSYKTTSIEEMYLDHDELWFEKDPRKRKQVKRATPSWANHEEIRQIYKKCIELRLRYPKMGFVVHHIIPISHPHICGLHVPENLSVVSTSLKMKLGRKFHKK